LKDSSLTLDAIFTHFYDIYNQILKDKGLIGVWRYRKWVLSDINSFKW